MVNLNIAIETAKPFLLVITGVVFTLAFHLISGKIGWYLNNASINSKFSGDFYWSSYEKF